MTTTTAQLTSTPARTPLLAGFGVVAAAALTAIGTFADLTGNDPNHAHESQTGEYLVTLGMIAVFAAVVFGLVVRTAPQGNAGRRAIAVGILAVLTVVVAWSGAPMVLAAGAASCAMTRRNSQGSYGTAGAVALGLSALATVGAITFAITG